MNINSLLSFAKAEVEDVICNPMKGPEKFETAVETGRDFVMQSCSKLLKSDEARMKETIMRLDASFAEFVKHLLE